MPRSAIVHARRNSYGRVYRVWYADDPPERQEAVTFFKSCGSLFPAINLPPAVHDMPHEQANRYLQDHPITEEWSMLTVGALEDVDLARLRHLPELQILQLGNVSDAGVAHLGHLRSLEMLMIASRRVTDACLVTVAQLQSLRYLDLQMAMNVSRPAFEAVLHALPRLIKAWPPP